ncbi:ABC transporter ATP-binding protein [Rhodobacteraceae bacterium RKSG542]|uniref:energy-coupling factor ABC transporter ATP-binding protein n=1 Tax=Pseudovibrio flavus TaxID=2529854 RepID=UPI0012BCD284|nr:ABC transporter ATP-binding protein [Pseudovibrio flavus]MTI16857.1 ABC transporter ATP-binding protein [Pseudovibrio flavus]
MPFKTIIEFNAVGYQSGEHEILKELNLFMSEPRIGIVGSNGSGKSTFLRLINGLLVPTTGEVWVDGLETRRCAKQVRDRISFVFQNPDNQIVLPTVEEDLAFGLSRSDLSAEIIAKRVDDVLERLDLAHKRHEPCHVLSGGQKQLLAIAGALVRRPATIIFDEPTTLLDLRNARRIADVIYSLEQNVITVTHDLTLLEGFDRVMVMNDGEVVADDTPKAALSYYRRLMS